MYKNPSVAVDAIVSFNKRILLIKRLKEPFKDRWAFPGGFVDYGESPLNAVIRELQEETSLQGHSPKLVGVFGEPNRDPRQHVISIAYAVSVDEVGNLKAADDAKEARFFEVADLIGNPNLLAFDHDTILRTYLQMFEPDYLQRETSEVNKVLK